MEEIVWNYLVELRKELMEAQKIRAQIIGFKITFISASFGILFVNNVIIDRAIFVIPALAAIFFDSLIYSYSFSIKRIGSYIREYAEPTLRKYYKITDDIVLWQQFLTQPKTKQYFSLYGDLGLTSISFLVALVALFNPFRIAISLLLTSVLVILFIIDIRTSFSHKKLDKRWGENFM
jgi:hypothetical protein